VKLHIGTGGWDYFPLPTEHKLKAYSQLFDFVEVNSTFYFTPSKEVTEKWRSAVPPDFEFSFKCSRRISHEGDLWDEAGLSREVERMVEVGRALRAKVILIETPPIGRSPLTSPSFEEAVDRFRRAGFLVAWECRSEVNEAVKEFMKSRGIIHSVDLTVAEPAYDSKVMYSRLFGKGQHTLYRFTESDFSQLKTRLERSKPREAYMVFHGVAMYAEAYRFKKRIERGLEGQAVAEL
jgi:uncharacterized protein YecE (DUF72 family)